MRQPPGVGFERESIMSSFGLGCDAVGILSTCFIDSGCTGDGVGSGFITVSVLVAAFLPLERGLAFGLTAACVFALPYIDGEP